VAQYLAIHPSLDEALANTRTRPSRLRERLMLGPVPTAARAGREFVREVCGRWGLERLDDPATLLASELVTNAVLHARTALELRVELRRSRLQLAVTDQDPDLTRVQAARDGTGRGLGLLVVDRVATAWGVRHDKAGGKVVWCTLELPSQDADVVGRGRRSQANTRTTSTAVATGGEGRRPPDAVSSPDPGLMWAKLVPPALRAGLISRAGLQSLLQAGLQAKLCLVGAPAGSGKTTLLAQWCAAAGEGRVAWVSLDEGDNDPTRFWIYVVEALRTVEPGVGTAALQTLQRQSVDLDRVALPSLLNDLNAIGSPLVLVLDDYNLVTDGACHQTLGVFLEHLPAGVHVVLATRVGPPLQLARMRARGELAELRVADLQFTDEEVSELLNEAMGLALGPDDVERLAERTEGWAAGLVLAGLSLRGRSDPSAFVAAFHGDQRHVADYLGAEVLARQPTQIREFLLRTSVLERLSGPLCDAVLETEGSAGILRELERSNVFLVPLDDHRQWYRCHHLFAELLRLELGQQEAASVPVLHRRAAAWHRQAGNIDEAIHHAPPPGSCRRRGR
jgi:anti-sigma regulatory factor (Ser/Thr protein kinase)